MEQLQAWIASAQALDGVGVADAFQYADEGAQATRYQNEMCAYRPQWEASRARRDSVRHEINSLVRADLAVLSTRDWTVTESESGGLQAARNFSKLALRAYNAEADYAMRTMQPHDLASHVNRLCKSKEAIARLGTAMHISVSDAYHDARVRELCQMADFLQKDGRKWDQKKTVPLSATPSCRRNADDEREVAPSVS